MAKVENPGGLPRRPPAVKGAFYIRQGARYGAVACAWPKPRDTMKTPAQRSAREQFLIAAEWSTQPVFNAMDFLLELAGQSYWTWRDVNMSCLYGKVITFTINGTTQLTYYSRRILMSEIQQYLDSITNAQGAILVRGPQGWQGLIPGAVGDVLAMQADGLPDWVEGGGGGGSVNEAVWSNTYSGENSDAFASQGVYLTFVNAITLTAIFAHCNNGANLNYTLSAAPYDPSTQRLTAAPTILWSGSTGPNNGNVEIGGKLASVIDIAAGETWAFFASYTGGVGTSQAWLNYGAKEQKIWPAVSPQLWGGMEAASTAPDMTTAWSNSNSIYSVALAYYLK